MSNKKRIQKKRQQLKDAAPVDLHNLKKVTSDLVEALKRIAEAVRNMRLDVSNIKPWGWGGLLVFENDQFGNKKTVFDVSREYKGNS